MKKKEWTVLMYLDGNNEMAPEMYDTVQNINVEIDKDKNIVIEIGQAPFKIVNSIRPYSKEQQKYSWTGVRRYLYENNEQKLISDLGNKTKTA